MTTTPIDNFPGRGDRTNPDIQHTPPERRVPRDYLPGR